MSHAPRVSGDASARQATQGPKVARWSSPAGWALAHTAPMQKHLRPLLGDLDKSTVSRMISGEKPSVVSRFFDLVRTSVLSDRATAGYLLAGAMLVAENAAAELPEDEIRARYLESCAQETIDQAGEDVATHHAVVAVSKDSSDMRACLEAQDAALCHEQARHADTLIYNRALRRHHRWRVEA